MTTSLRRLITVAAALGLLALIAESANACCGATTTAYYQPTTAFYQPTTTFYQPTYTTNYAGGWYPGYWADRVRTRLWGQPTAYVAAYPTSSWGYTASYAPSCPSCSTCSACSSCASPCSTCASYAPSCSTCSSCTAGYAPSCSCGSSCGCSSCEAGCPSCAAQPVTQTSYVQPSCGCSAGVASTTTAPQQNVVSAPPAQPTPAEPKPTLESTQPQAQPSSPASTTAQHPVEPATPPAPAPQTQPAQPAAAHPEYDVKKNENSTYLESPKLFNPQDRTAKRSIAPVHTALYEQPAKYSKISTAQTVLDAEQVKKDAAGWSN